MVLRGVRRPFRSGEVPVAIVGVLDGFNANDLFMDVLQQRDDQVGRYVDLVLCGGG